MLAVECADLMPVDDIYALVKIEVYGLQSLLRSPPPFSFVAFGDCVEAMLRRKSDIMFFVKFGDCVEAMSIRLH